MMCVVLGKRLPPPHDRVDVERIQLESKAAPPSPLSGNQSGTAPKETIQHDVAARGGVHDSVGDHRGGLHSRVEAEQIAFVAGSRKRTRARIAPYIASIAAVHPQHHVV